MPLLPLNTEALVIAYLDANNRPIAVDRMSQDCEDCVALPLRQIIGDALRHNATAIMLAHNHPSGIVEPSIADREATRLLCRAARPLGLRIVDHIVVAGKRWTSFRARGLL